jgi:ectoine hydroxylase-related dioxygenase (phytanoyl-CoA dioxygenase family)
LPFQTINFLKGSEQHAHSDWIHMSTFPKGYLIAAWFALEDITVEQGAVSYFPGSHLLPYLNNSDYPNSSNRWMVDGHANQKYEAKMQAIIEEHRLQKKIFTAKKGDMLIWHGNLIHGGEPMLHKEMTRKSMVAHYFAEGVICYHEISERPAIFDTELVGEVQEEFYKGQTDILNIGW